MIQPANQRNKMHTVITQHVKSELTPEEIYAAFTELMEKMKTPDPDNPNLWSVEIGEKTLWGILDEGAGPQGSDLFTILFPSDY